MKIVKIDKKITYFELPQDIDGSFVVYDSYDIDYQLFNIEAYKGQWVLMAGDNAKFINGREYTENIALVNDTFYLFEKDGKRRLFYAQETFDDTFKYFYVNSQCNLTIGQHYQNDIAYNQGYVGQNCVNLVFNGQFWTLAKLDNTLVFVNDTLLESKAIRLNNGDQVFIYGLRMYFLGKMLLINSPGNKVKVGGKLQLINADQDEQEEKKEIKEKALYEESDYFLKSPRIKRFIEEKEFQITAPPNREKEDDTPALFVLGPMLATGAASVASFTNMLQKLVDGTSTIDKCWPQLISAGAMLTTTLLWPNLNKRWKKKQAREKEEVRQNKYKEYLAEKQRKIQIEMNNEAIILQENLPTAEQCKKIILEKQRVLWERKIEHKDFLTARIGIGTFDTMIKCQYEIEDFSMEEDNLKSDLENMVEGSKKLFNVPIGYSFCDNRFVTVFGNEQKVDAFMKSLLVQFLAFHSYDELKIVVLTDEFNEHKWEYLKTVPHCFSDDKQMRFFASTKEERQQISNYLLQYVKSRTIDDEGKLIQIDYKQVKPYFLIITDIVSDVRKLDAIDAIFETDNNIGFSILIQEKFLSKVPSKCTNFINIGITTSDVLKNDEETSTSHQFNDELKPGFNIDDCCKLLSNIPIKLESDNRALPNALSFLAMFNVGKVEQLNVSNRWRMNNPIKTLRAEVGVDELGDKVYLDLHEKAHGPHGLVAGMTGSGKSEFIITYILSMALNYNPNEVAFILIDYKGGGLVGAFENEKTGVKLPHLAGKITNLDKAEMKRTLVSINSELRRRQAVFNKVRDELGESTIDIYKYQKFYRAGRINEPVPHLFIISDEFAELKSQQPEFMDELISAARIGRSLGVHLILATQKPSGVVNEQIWSNTKFRVCLRVQDKGDSNEMIKCPLAAEIRNPGRFYLQVGYNEIFMLGQSGYCGTPYTPSNAIKKSVDRSVDLISNTGEVLSSNEYKPEVTTTEVSKGDELSNVLKHIIDVAEKEHMQARKMWLDSIPEIIYVDDLVKKYNVAQEPYKVTAIVGELDDPKNQRQDILTIPLTDGGNSLVFSISGSDKDRILNSIIYSSTIGHSPEEINLYIVDYGAETLRAFKNLPHVGDTVFSGEKEKLTNLLKMIGDEISFRKKEFTDYSGDYNIYIKNSGKKLPIISVIINDIDSLTESDASVQDVLIQYTRDCERYGISFIITGSSFSMVRGRLRMQCKNKFVLEMNTNDDYTAIVGNWKDVCLFNLPGRGLVPLDAIYEFQTASIFPQDEFTDKLKETIEQYKTTYNGKHAKRIPVLPEEVSLALLKDNLTDISSIPIGMYRDSLECATIDMTQSVGSIIAANEIKETKSLLSFIIKEFEMLGNNNILIVDNDKLLEEYKDKYQYINSDFEDFFTNKVDSFLGLAGQKIMIMVEPKKIEDNAKNDNMVVFSNKIKTREDFKILFIVSNSRGKDLAVSTWYSTIVNKQSGVWVGSGFADQGVIRCPTLAKEMKESFKSNYGWQVKNGIPQVVKYIVKEEDADE